MRRAARIDENQPEIMKALRAAGVVVVPTHAVGKGFPDLVCAFRKQTVLLELKDGSKPPSRRELTPDEVDFHVRWCGGPLHVVNNVDEALIAVGVLKEPA